MEIPSAIDLLFKTEKSESDKIDKIRIMKFVLAIACLLLLAATAGLEPLILRCWGESSISVLSPQAKIMLLKFRRCTNFNLINMQAD